MKVRLLSRHEYRLFATRFKMESGSPALPTLAYLALREVYGAFVGDRLIGGFARGCKRPWRYLAWLPAELEREWDAALVSRRVVEVACIWLDPAASKGWRSYIVCAHIALAITRSGANALLIGTRTPPLIDAYKAAFGPPIDGLEHNGPVTVDGMKTTGWVALVPVPTALRALRGLALVNRRHPRRQGK